MLLDQRNLN